MNDIEFAVRMEEYFSDHSPHVKQKRKMTNSEWIDFLVEQFNISRSSAKEMLHVMMSVKRRDNLKKQLNRK